MDEKESLIIKENAYKDYILGMKYKDIAEKYNVSINTVKSWKRRLNWQRKMNPKKGAKLQRVQDLAKEIQQDLLNQLKENGTYGRHFEDLVNDYMELWDIKNRLIENIKTNGVSIEWSNGKQFGIKRNDSIRDLNQTSTQMLKILSDLGLKPPKEPLEDDDDDM